MALFYLRLTESEILTPPYFNLAQGKNITASATCGEDTEGPELYCKLVGADAEHELNINVIQGQVSSSHNGFFFFKIRRTIALFF